MAKVNVLLKDGTDETTFINDVTSNSEVDLVNRLPNSPTLVVLDIEESYFDTLRSHSSVVSVEVEAVAEAPVTYPSKPSLYTSSGISKYGVGVDKIDELGITQKALELGIKRCSLENSPLPIVMWSYGLISLSQLKMILSWQNNY